MSADGYYDCPECKEEHALRAYHEFYVSEQALFIDFSAECRECGYEFEFQDKKEMIAK